jgi:hypothetical protein
MRENRTYGSEGGVSRRLIPTPIAIMLSPRREAGSEGASYLLMKLSICARHPCGRLDQPREFAHRFAMLE